MKAAPVIAALSEKKGIDQVLVHTGQHYDDNMSDIFFRQLGLPQPEINLEVGSKSHAVQTAQIMIRFEKIALKQRPDLVLVYGDVNSTVAAALVCSKIGIVVGHVEAGLRSFDRTMPEEINRLLTDQIADFLFTPSTDADANLLGEGVARDKIHRVGNVMIDSLVRLLPQAQLRWKTGHLNKYSDGKKYCLVTLHRPSNVDNPNMLAKIIEALNQISHDIPVVFPIHPRTKFQLQNLTIEISNSDLKLLDPLSYLDFLALQTRACVVITDSGGIQEETTYLKVPCLTVRKNTERPITVKEGTNILVGQDMESLKKEVIKILSGSVKKTTVPPLWDGHAGKRIADVVSKF
jgi:UDP-N-acetylglucosamine 2-epimerase (non-hydrolysing)